MIVDDEELLRTGLCKMIERMELPITVVGAACDGVEGLKMMEIDEPNVVLTDIRMPNIDGLALIRKLSEQYPRVRTIILSGYDDFDYAKQAIKLGCKDYLVKPPDFAELSELLSAIYQEFSQEREELIQLSQKNELLVRNQLLLQTDYLRKLISGKPNASISEIKEQAERLNISFLSDAYRLAILNFENRHELLQKYTPKEIGLLQYACWNITSEITQGAPCFYDELEQLIIMLPESYSYEESCEKLQEIRKSITHYLGLSVTAVLSNFYSLQLMNEGYSEAKRLLTLRLLREKSVLITVREARAHINEDIQPLMQPLRELQLLDTYSDIERQLKQWVIAVKGSAYTPAALERLKQELRIALIVLVRKLSIQEDNLGDHETIKWLEQMDMADSFTDCIKPVLQVINQANKQQETHSPYQSQSVDKAIAFIRANYNQDINLTMISEHVNKNPAYFSVMFKKKTGLGVIEYLTDFRMELAKKLLVETQMKTYQIAESTGYNDPAYFSNTFKRHSGTTPQEYRNSATIDSTRNP
ncbi:hypothetical protein KCTCHS21_06730 [Cohnella abietis]|uniref:AraC family transcriptional regulator n=1 Tax=Cohnella abietis TaxID=2507935 RepID=A0A3T1CZL4_9BACL|nr:hypothetical protein KCTCHS21_06730 [Cohnella abietis]